MLKKKLVTIVAAVFCVALVTAQESGVKKVTTGLIEDGAIDSLKFGTEDGSGVIFGQYDKVDDKITLGWGNSLSDTLWLSVFDSWYYLSSSTTTTDKATNDATADDGINVDYTKTTRETDGSGSTHIGNELGVGVGINNKLGFQLDWKADYLFNKAPAAISATSQITDTTVTNGEIKSEVNDPGAGTNTQKEWTKYTNHNIDNNFTVNFKGIGIEDVGDIAFFVKLNKVYFKWNNTTRSGDYTETSSTNGKKTSEITTTGKYSSNTLNPGLNFDLGLNLISNDVATVKFVYEDDFNIKFNPRTNESEKTVKNLIASATTETTDKNTYKVEYGKYLAWENKFEPKFVSEFNVLEGLQLKAQLALPVTIGQTINEAAKYESTSETETFNRTFGYSDRTTSKTITTGQLTAGSKNSDVFTTTFAPKLSAGFVYQVAPGKFNVNFGAAANPTYTWTTTTKTNSGINVVTTTETKDGLGNVKTSKAVTAGQGDAVKETRVTEVTTTCPTSINLGATWFFTENVNFDAYFLHSFGENLFDTTSAGASVTVKF